MAAKMTFKERFACAMQWQQPDRPPVQIYLTPEMHASLEAYFGKGKIDEALEIDFVMTNAPYRGPMKSSRDGLWFDEWGAGYKHIANAAAGTYDEAVELPLAAIQTMDDFRQYPWPRAEDCDYSQIAAFCQQHQNRVIQVGHPGAPDIVNGVSRGRGMEQVLTDIVTRDEVGLAIIDTRCEYYYRVFERTLEAGRGKIDMLCLGEDTGNQFGRMVSPRDFDEVFRPRIQRFIDLGHRFGCKVMMHSCGDTHDLQPTFMEMGLDILDAMQPEPPGMHDLAGLRRKAFGKMAFCGLLSTQQTLPHGTEAQCRAEARHRLDTIALGGGYIFAPAHCIQPDTPLRNVLAIYEEALGKRLM